MVHSDFIHFTFVRCSGRRENKTGCEVSRELVDGRAVSRLRFDMAGFSFWPELLTNMSSRLSSLHDCNSGHVCSDPPYYPFSFILRFLLLLLLLLFILLLHRPPISSSVVTAPSPHLTSRNFRAHPACAAAVRSHTAAIRPVWRCGLIELISLNG